MKKEITIPEVPIRGVSTEYLAKKELHKVPTTKDHLPDYLEIFRKAGLVTVRATVNGPEVVLFLEKDQEKPETDHLEPFGFGGMTRVAKKQTITS